MKSSLLKFVTGTALALGIAATSQATLINGSAGFAGTFTSNGSGGNLTTATVLSVPSAVLLSAQNDFSGSALGSFASTFHVNPATPILGVLFTLTKGLTTYTFTVNTETQTADSANTISLSGTGTVSDGNSADNTSGNWQINFGATDAAFTFQSTAGTATVPDGGSTLMLIGAGLSGLGLLRRKLA